MNRQPMVYRLYSEDQDLLYVGITDQWARRMKEHSRSQWWWDEVAFVQLIKCATMQNARDIESRMIAAEQPLRSLQVKRYDPDPRNGWWRNDEVQTLLDNAHLGGRAIAELLDRSERSVYAKAHKMGIPLGTPRKPRRVSV